MPNIAAEWLALLLRIQEVLGSILDTETGYTEVFHSLSQFLQAKAGIEP
jgi:hypothetical protein